MPRAATWAEERSRVAENRPRRWLTGSDWPYFSETVFDARVSEDQIARGLHWQGWPVVPCTERCEHGDWSREFAKCA